MVNTEIHGYSSSRHPWLVEKLLNIVAERKLIPDSNYKPKPK